MKKTLFNTRAFVSASLLVSGLLLPVSGLMNHLNQCDSMNLVRHFWMSIHDTASLLFVAFAIFHIALNWKSLIRYLKNNSEVLISKEAIVAILVVCVIIGLTTSHVFYIDP